LMLGLRVQRRSTILRPSTTLVDEIEAEPYGAELGPAIVESLVNGPESVRAARDDAVRADPAVGGAAS
jgi:hypothetical protein